MLAAIKPQEGTDNNSHHGVNQLNQNVDSEFQLLNASIACLKQSVDIVEQSVTSNESGLNEHKT